MAIVKKYSAEVVRVENKVEGIYTVEFKSLASPFKYLPGQFLHLAMEEYDPSSGWPESRCFSIQSSPVNEYIWITFAIKGVFTSRMSKELIPGRKVTLKLPYGDLFTKDHSRENTIFIAGGTGITPFLSLFTHASFKEYNNPRIYLGFRSKQYNIYEHELNFVKPYNPKIYYEDTIGRLDVKLIFSENGSKSDYFISGPPEMINVFKQELIANGVITTQIFTDEWE